MNFGAAPLALCALALALCLCQVSAVKISNSLVGKFDVPVSLEATGADLKEALATKLSVEANSHVEAAVLRVFKDGQELEDGKRLADYKLDDQSEVSFVVAKSQKASNYFGVDANDKEAVERKQRELSEQKFRELFGEEVADDFGSFEFPQPESEKERMSIKQAFNWLRELIKRKIEHYRGGPKTTAQPESTTSSTTL